MICKITTSCGSLMLTPYLKTVIRRKMQYNVVLTVSRDFFPTSTKSKAGVSNLNLYEGHDFDKK